MIRKKIVAGNWKMNKTLTEGVELARAVADGYELMKEGREWMPEVIMAPPFISLPGINEIVSQVPGIYCAAQNCHQEEKGAFTGEVSAAMIASIGVKYVILGHSERRTYFGESNALLARKTDAVLKQGLLPIFCIGEVLAEREKGIHFNIIKQQIEEGLFHLDESVIKKIIIAYEPVWAIGTGLTASPAQAQEMHAFIRSEIARKYGTEIAQYMVILYGGSCNARNASELFACEDVDGGLIGGASLVPNDFLTIIDSFQSM